jgi:hypothetical protein
MKHLTKFESFRDPAKPGLGYDEISLGDYMNHSYGKPVEFDKEKPNHLIEKLENIFENHKFYVRKGDEICGEFKEKTEYHHRRFLIVIKKYENGKFLVSIAFIKGRVFDCDDENGLINCLKEHILTK